MNRDGIRRPRKQGFRNQELGHYLIVTDTEKTEANYFNKLKEAMPNRIKGKLVIEIKKGRKNLVDECLSLLEYSPNERIPWIIFDYDKIENFDSLIKKANDNNINAGWSNPCIEIWFCSYFGKMESCESSQKCTEKFGEIYKRRTSFEYKKSDEGIYNKLIEYGNEEMAIKNAKERHRLFIKNKKKPSEMNPSSTLYILVEEIREKFKKI